MSENSTSNSSGRGLRADQLPHVPDDAIDTSDIPEVTDWSGAVRGRFYRPNAVHQTPVYLDSAVREDLELLALRTGQDVDTLASELLRREMEHSETPIR